MAQAVAKMEEGFDAEDLPPAPADADMADPQLLGVKANPDKGSKPSRKRGRDVADWGDEAELDAAAAARARSGRVSVART